MYVGETSEGRPFRDTELMEFCSQGLTVRDCTGQRVLVIIPDTTRSGPTGLLFRTICQALLPSVKQLDFLIALGTHPVMSAGRVSAFLGREELRLVGRMEKEVRVFQHQWDNPDHLCRLGIISAAEIEEISGGLLKEDIPVTVNRKILHYDQLILAGPVFPHEVVGFSGGYKYLFPGISGPDFLNKFHWLGALITNPKINGTKDTPVRRAINLAVSFLEIPVTLLCYVVKEKKVFGFYAGDEEAWSAAVELSGRLNVQYKEQPFHTVLSMAPEMYEDLWTAGKCMYKLEPVVADGGTLIIYAPHVKEVSRTHGVQIKQVGYHTRDYFLKQWPKFRDVPGCILAHSTHVKGIGVYRDGVEKPRINVVLATGIPEKECREINLGYLDYTRVNPEEYAGREQEGILRVQEAGEVLFRLADGTVPDIDKLYQV